MGEEQQRGKRDSNTYYRDYCIDKLNQIIYMINCRCEEAFFKKIGFNRPGQEYPDFVLYNPHDEERKKEFFRWLEEIIRYGDYDDIWNASTHDDMKKEYRKNPKIYNDQVIVSVNSEKIWWDLERNEDLARKVYKITKK